jgi:hypothetical protein
LRRGDAVRECSASRVGNVEVGLGGGLPSRAVRSGSPTLDGREPAASRPERRRSAALEDELPLGLGLRLALSGSRPRSATAQRATARRLMIMRLRNITMAGPP